MKKFYAVTAGDYSDYHIVAITDDKEKAERIKDLCNRGNSYGYDNYANIEEYGEATQDDLLCYSVYLWNNNGEIHAYVEFNGFMEHDINKVEKRWDGYCVYVKAEDESHAIKIGSDLIAQYKAQENGIA